MTDELVVKINFMAHCIICGKGIDGGTFMPTMEHDWSHPDKRDIAFVMSDEELNNGSAVETLTKFAEWCQEIHREERAVWQAEAILAGGNPMNPGIPRDQKGSQND